MTILTILNKREQRELTNPPRFDSQTRTLHFTINDEVRRLVNQLRTPTNKVGFLLQLGYFRAAHQFFAVEQFRQEDIKYVANLLDITLTDVEFFTYAKASITGHRQKILHLLKWKPYTPHQEKKLIKQLHWHVSQQAQPKNVLYTAIEYLRQQCVELPSYHALSTLITNAYNTVEKRLITQLGKQLTQQQQTLLDQLLASEVDTTPNSKLLPRPLITLLKRINQSLRPSDIQQNVDAFNQIKKYFLELESVINQLNLSDTTTQYYANWVSRAKTYQLAAFPNRFKCYLHLLAYIKHQFYYRQDILVDILLKSVRSTQNAAKTQLQQQDKQERVKQQQAIQTLCQTQRNSQQLVEDIQEILNHPLLSSGLKITKIEELIANYNDQQQDGDEAQLDVLEQQLKASRDKSTLFSALTDRSIKLQRRVSEIVKSLLFDENSSDEKLIEAVNHFQTQAGTIRHPSPLDFLSAQEKKSLQSAKSFKPSLYKVFLFIHMADGIKSGRLNLRYSYRYRAIQSYLIDDQTWHKERDSLIQAAGLSHFQSAETVLDRLKVQLEAKYQQTNEHYNRNQNPYLSFDDNGKLKISTPKIDHDESKFITAALSQNNYIPILQILSEVQQATDFLQAFKHMSIKHKKMKPTPETLFAGLIGQGCNIGVNRMARISTGISEDVLENTVNWFFTLPNLQKAVDRLTGFINQLALPDIYRHDNEQLHSSSDGRKVTVAVDSLHAAYSYKYYGKDQGVAIYTFIDERQLLFYSTVISASAREAAYVMDGLLQNDVVKVTIHSTDTHGFTETVFAATPFIDTAFAPRIKNIGKQRLYSFTSKRTYEKRGYKILPSRTINQKLIIQYWDDILRFMATIKLKHATASQLFSRLSSYAKDHPLYRALKEFGRIMKSIFILTYLDDVELRQRIELQLNRVELSNKFSKAVFFANNQEFQDGMPEKQKIVTACKVLIQNAIIVWNYLALSQLVADQSNPKERQQLINRIKQGSVICWQHVNLQGEYDFTQTSVNDSHFNLAKILALKLA